MLWRPGAIPQEWGSGQGSSGWAPHAWAGGWSCFPLLGLGKPWRRACGQVSLETESLGSPAAHFRA